MLRCNCSLVNELVVRVIKQNFDNGMCNSEGCKKRLFKSNWDPTRLSRIRLDPKKD